MADINYGEYQATIKHESVGREKGEFTISFASGKLSVRNVRLKAEESKSEVTPVESNG